MRRVNIRTGSNYAERIPVQWKQKAAGQRLLSKRLVIVMAEKRVMPIFFPWQNQLKNHPSLILFRRQGVNPAIRG